MSAQASERALLELVQADRDRRCAEILAQARERAAQQRAQAAARARARMRAAFAEERARVAERLAAARARLATQQRLRRQSRASELLALGWQALPAALASRWRDPAARQQWVASVVERGLALLPRGQWLLAHAPQWPDDERRAVAQRLAVAGIDAQFAPDAAISAGLKIASGGNLLDASGEGLLADRDAVGASLLRAIEDAPR